MEIENKSRKLHENCGLIGGNENDTHTGREEGGGRGRERIVSKVKMVHHFR